MEKSKQIKQRNGKVIKKSGEFTISVNVEGLSRNTITGKVFKTSKKYLVHDPKNKGVVGESVTIQECRPISKHKRWRIIK